MFDDRSRAAILGASIAIGVAGVPGFAQSNGVRARATASEMADTRTVPDVVAVYRKAHAVSADVDTPPNLSFPPMYRETIQTMVLRSAMFRRQLLRLAAAPHATVILRNAIPSPTSPRARTLIRRTDDGRLIAAVEIQAPGDLDELIAHELEHVIEQLDGVDLAVRAALSGTGVHTCGDGTFETMRAVRIGLLVKRQTRGDN